MTPGGSIPDSDQVAQQLGATRFRAEPRDQSHVDLLIPGVRDPEQSQRGCTAIRSVIHPWHAYEAMISP